MGTYFISVILPGAILFVYSLIQYYHAVRMKKCDLTKGNNSNTKLVVRMALLSSLIGLSLTMVFAYLSLRYDVLNLPKNPLTVTIHYIAFVLIYNSLMDNTYRILALLYAYKKAKKTHGRK